MATEFRYNEAHDGSDLHVIDYPSGRFGFVGRVPAVLGYARIDGAPLTAQDAADLAHVGPGFLKYRIRGRSWATEAEARAEAARLGFEVAP